MGSRAPPRDQRGKKSGVREPVTSTNTRAPAGLTPLSRALWRKVLGLYRLETPDLRLLELACRQLDRAQEAEATLAEEGLFVQDRFGQTKAHPALEAERQASLTFARLCRELGLGADEIGEVRLPRGRTYRD